MSCSEAERLFVAGAPDAAQRAHAASCPACAAAFRDHEEVAGLTSFLRPPAWSPDLRQALARVPALTVSCEGADALIARMLEGEIDDSERARLDFHRSRCGACAEAAETLLGIRALTAPVPAPWFTGRMAASVRPRATRAARSGWRAFIGPKTAIALAYAAAFVVMILGFNPADMARRARTDLPAEARSVVAGAQSTVADRVGAVEERILRTALVVRSRVFGYGRAALTNAVQLVLKSEAPAPSGRPRNGSEKGTPPKNETAITTWRA